MSDGQHRWLAEENRLYWAEWRMSCKIRPLHSKACKEEEVSWRKRPNCPHEELVAVHILEMHPQEENKGFGGWLTSETALENSKTAGDISHEAKCPATRYNKAVVAATLYQGEDHQYESLVHRLPSGPYPSNLWWKSRPIAASQWNPYLKKPRMNCAQSKVALAYSKAVRTDYIPPANENRHGWQVDSAPDVAVQA